MNASDHKQKVVVSECGKAVGQGSSLVSISNIPKTKPKWTSVKQHIRDEPWRRRKKGRR